MESVLCTACDMWLNGPAQYADHIEGKKHRRKSRGVQVPRRLADKIQVPRNTVLLLEQQALRADIEMCIIVRRALYSNIAAKL